MQTLLERWTGKEIYMHIDSQNSLDFVYQGTRGCAGRTSKQTRKFAAGQSQEVQLDCSPSFLSSNTPQNLEIDCAGILY